MKQLTAFEKSATKSRQVIQQHHIHQTAQAEELTIIAHKGGGTVKQGAGNLQCVSGPQTVSSSQLRRPSRRLARDVNQGELGEVGQ